MITFRSANSSRIPDRPVIQLTVARPFFVGVFLCVLCEDFYLEEPMHKLFLSFHLKSKIVFWLLLTLLISHYTWDHAAYVTDFLTTASERSLVIFAIARGINGVISVIQSAEVGFSFAVSASLAPGEILDPINDLIERFSLVMLVASASLWIFRFLSELILSPLLLWLAMGLYLMGQLLPQVEDGNTSLLVSSVLMRLSTAAVILISAFIGMALTTDAVHQSNQVQNEFNQSQRQLDENLIQLQQINTGLLGQTETIECDGMGDCAQYYARQATESAETISRSVITQIAIFVLETLLIPLSGLWLAARLITIYAIRRRPTG